MKISITIIICLFSIFVNAQTSTIRGKVIDKQSEKPIAGANISLLGVENGAEITDADGNFKLLNVPLGRQTIQVSFIGYDNASIPDIDVVSGKENNLIVSLTEKFNTLNEVVISGGINKAKAINKMAAVSVRQFSLEEVNRYAGGRSDVARLASNFAGVSTADDSRNDIIVRGNSPVGLLWRLEGLPIPSPNHFSTLGTTGSPVSALNPNLLANSDFLTAVFPAEYGNAIGGVFDLGFRKGNTEKYEYTVSVGAYPGVEAMAEGPLLKNGGSFVASVRYGIVGALGLGGTSSRPNYNDISFNIDMGRSKIGNFSLFGIYGSSNIDLLGNNIKKDDLFGANDENTYIKSGFSSFGLKHLFNIGEKSFLKTTIGFSNSMNTYNSDRFYNLNQTNELKIRFTEIDNKESRVTFSTLFNSKINKKLTFRTGLLLEQFTLKANTMDRRRQLDGDLDGYPDLVTIINSNNKYTIFQPYAQAQFRISEKITFNAGLHGHYFSLNKEFALEPRTSFSYAVNNNNTINLGYGIHHQNVAAPLLFLNEKNGTGLVQTNRNLDLVRSQHFVLGYDVRLANKWRGKAEVYYQIIDKAGVEKTPTGYSTLTEGASFNFSIDKNSLVSTGKGSNRGIEFTLEKFFGNGYHGLFTTSIFESKYKGSDNIERDSPFNNGFILNTLAGKEFKIGKTKKNVFLVDTKFTTAGGRHYTPINLVASNAVGFEIRDNTKPFSEKYSNYLRLDLKLGMKFNSKTKKQSHQFYIDFQNVTNNKNVFSRDYNRLTNRVDQRNQIGFAPDFGYKFQF
jgi:CarboxypepD_reg-like domain/TonB-dependent Receptor Plug Domain